MANKPNKPAQGPSEAELTMIRGCAIELQAALPNLSQDDAIHFAAEAVKEQRILADSIAQLQVAVRRGDKSVSWLSVTVFKPQSNVIETGTQVETIATFAGPSRPQKTNSPMQIVGAAVARSLCTSVFARALLYANGMRLRMTTADAPVREVK